MCFQNLGGGAKLSFKKSKIQKKGFFKEDPLALKKDIFQNLGGCVYELQV